ncbi:hypothetical protein ColKHC_06940 [Colletotrichum higginsianum]|nr:hypothetical protein ColKHC_06940 [Colletotrichum higginsianum]
MVIGSMDTRQIDDVLGTTLLITFSVPNIRDLFLSHLLSLSAARPRANSSVFTNAPKASSPS